MYSGKSVCIQINWMYSGKMGLFGQGGYIWVKVAVFGQKLLYSAKSSCIRINWCFSVKKKCICAKVVVFGQDGCIRQKVFVYGQGGCIRAKVDVIGLKWL